MFAQTDRAVARTEIRPDPIVSTVFLGMGHAYGLGPPLLFETMVFPDGDLWDEHERYTTWAEAEAGHQAMCDRVRVVLAGTHRDE